GKMTNWRVNECDFVNALIFSSWMGNTRIYESGLNGSAFQYATFDDSNFNGSSFKNCKIQNCDLTGLTIDGINVKDALEFYKQHQL
ncbi:MAG: pentapeptide repeat-containing protein, partial [Clostridia bacterium]|nr:pentapeptide repeat-containing protein [Clostridia bacterium]